VSLSDPADDTPRIAEAVELARRSDVAVLVLGGNEGTCREGWWFNHLGDRDDLDLLGRQQELVEGVLATGTPTIAVLINGRPLTIQYLAEDVPAILECWYLGQATGTAVADVLFGEVNPSGKLPLTFPRFVGQLPVYYYHRPSAKRGYAFADSQPLYPFGFGLSYTTFEYGELTAEVRTTAGVESIELSFTVTNTGTRAGIETPQVYAGIAESEVDRPVRKLVGFARAELEPGASQVITVRVPVDELAYYDVGTGWVIEPGTYTLEVGRNVADRPLSVDVTR
jgi:beta-glucosidase